MSYARALRVSTVLAAALAIGAPPAHANESIAPAPPRGGIFVLGRGLGEPPLHPMGPNDKLKYYGGKVIANVEVVAVFWTGAVAQQTQQQIGSFYGAIVKSAYIDWLTEYDTINQSGYADMMPGSNQHIGRGTFGGAKIITPINTKTALTDAEVAAELVAQIQANNLPPPKLDALGNVNTLYMFDFPPGYDILLEGWHACQQYGAYHFTATRNGKSIPYGVHPDCGYPWTTATAIHSHELIEAITDPEVGLVNQNAPTARPIAWVTLANTAWASLEIADICQNQGYLTVAGYTVAKEWSNFAQACVVTIPVCDGIVIPPACRPCNAFDSGNACDLVTPACATKGPKQGQCVPCTADTPKSCTGATPVCDDANYVCVGCNTSADCTTATAPVCEPKTKTCRACAKDNECANGKVCDLADAGSTAGQCVECTSDAQCGAKKCDLKTRACVAPPPDAGPGEGGADGGDVVPTQGGCSCDVGSPAGASPRWLLGIVVLANMLRRRRPRVG